MKTHWKKTVDKDWIGCYVLPLSGKPDTGSPDSNPYLPIKVKLIRVMYEEVEVRGRKGLYKVGYFDKNKHFDKPMLMQANVNLRRISKLVGSPAIEDWGDINMDVTLQAEWDKKVGKGKDWALRIAEEAPKKAELTPESKKWDDAIKALKSGNVKMDQIKAAYDISTKNEEALNEAIQSKSEQ